MSNVGLMPVIGSDEIRLLVSGGWSAAADAAVAAGGFTRLELQRGEYPNLQCLVSHASQIRSLWINASCTSTAGLEQLKWLERLKVSYPLDRFDFSSLSELRHLAIDGWRKTYASSLFRCERLESLSIEGYDQSDCTAFGVLKQLRSIELARGKLRTLAGLAACDALQSVTLSHLRELFDIDEILRLPWLRRLELPEALPALKFPMSVTGLTSLAHLDLRGLSQGLDNTEWLRDFRNLQVLLLPKVAAVDWDAVFSSPKLTKLLVGPSSCPGVTSEEVTSIATKHGLVANEVSRLGSKKAPAFLVDLRPAS